MFACRRVDCKLTTMFQRAAKPFSWLRVQGLGFRVYVLCSRGPLNNFLHVRCTCVSMRVSLCVYLCVCSRGPHFKLSLSLSFSLSLSLSLSPGFARFRRGGASPMKARALMLPPPLLSYTPRRLQRSFEKVSALASALCGSHTGRNLENEQRCCAA
jgi:hypothetical protein